MELKEFIKSALTDIASAVAELQKELDNGTILNPTLFAGENTVNDNGDKRKITEISFDVAVTASESSDVDGKVKAGINIFGAHVGAGSASKTENVSRLTFSIPVLLPCTHIKTADERWKEEQANRRPVSQCRQETLPL